MAYNQLDLYHRAFKAYKTELERDEKVSKLHKAICSAVVSNEHLEAVRFKCNVKNDWIEAIEKGMPFIEKAILENRQFILQQGEVQLVEKAKRVSKSSVDHLAKHSELITHLPKPGEDVIPDKIYVVENDSNFAVYENRFLYMLLLNISDFINVKYAKIVELWNKYESSLEIKKNVFLGKRKLEFSLSLKEESQNDADTAYDEEACVFIARISELQRSVAALLHTPLMKEVSHAPIVKSPITRTNVLKMDTNFKMAVELYDFLCAYEEDGYVVQQIGESFDCFGETMEDDFAEIVAASSYLTYRYGGKLNALMEHRYETKNKLLREEEDRRHREHLKNLKERLDSGEYTVEEYLKALEERNVSLEQDRDRINVVENEIGECKQALYLSRESNDALCRSVEELQGEIRDQRALADRIKAEHKAELERQRLAFEAELFEMQKKHDELVELHMATMVQLRGIRQQHGLLTADDDYSSKEMLVQLEKEREAFDKLFASQWKAAKKQIRKKALGKAKSTDATPDKNNG